MKTKVLIGLITAALSLVIVAEGKIITITAKGPASSSEFTTNEVQLAADEAAEVLFFPRDQNPNTSLQIQKNGMSFWFSSGGTTTGLKMAGPAKILVMTPGGEETFCTLSIEPETFP